MKVIVKGDHPIFKRPDKIFDNEHDGEVTAYVGELTKVGYENVRVEPLKPYKSIFPLDETPMACAECLAITPKSQLTEIESCPRCWSHKIYPALNSLLRFASFD